jgi:hypothetical protein
LACRALFIRSMRGRQRSTKAARRGHSSSKPRGTRRPRCRRLRALVADVGNRAVQLLDPLAIQVSCTSRG